MRLIIHYKEFERDFNVELVLTVEELYESVRDDLRIDPSTFSLYYETEELVNDNSTLQGRGFYDHAQLLVVLKEDPAIAIVEEPIEIDTSANEQPSIHLKDDDNNLHLLKNCDEVEFHNSMEIVFEDLQLVNPSTSSNNNNSDNFPESQLPSTSSSESTKVQLVSRSISKQDILEKFMIYNKQGMR